MQTREGLCPSHDFIGSRPGSVAGDMLGLLHCLLLSYAVSEVRSHMYRVSHLKEKIMKLFPSSEDGYCSAHKCHCSDNCKRIAFSLLLFSLLQFTPFLLVGERSPLFHSAPARRVHRLRCGGTRASHRGAFEPVLADEDQEQDPDRWCSHAPAGQEAWQIVSQW